MYGGNSACKLEEVICTMFFEQQLFGIRYFYHQAKKILGAIFRHVWNQICAEKKKLHIRYIDVSKSCLIKHPKCFFMNTWYEIVGSGIINMLVNDYVKMLRSLNSNYNMILFIGNFQENNITKSSFIWIDIYNLIASVKLVI